MIFGFHLFIKADFCYNFVVATVCINTMREIKLYVPLMLLLLFFGCGAQEPSPHEDLLYQVECRFQIMPDNAFKMLDSLDVTQLSVQERAHYNLVRAQTLGLLRYNPKVIDSLLNEAEQYYSKSDDKYHEAMTYWQRSSSGGLLGYGLQYTMDYRQKALQTIEQCKHVDPRLVQYSIIPTDEQNEIDRLKYGIHQRLGMSYTSCGYHREGIKHLLLAEQYYDRQKRYNLHNGTAYMLASAYTLIYEYDSSQYYLKKGLQSAEALGNVAECGYYYFSSAGLSLFRYETQTELDDDIRNELLHQAVKESMKGLEVLGDTDERLANGYRLQIFEELSRAYCFLQEYDSCIFYGRKVFDFYEDKTSKFQLKRLYTAYKGLGDEENAALFAELLLNLEEDYGGEQKAIAEVKDEYEKQLEINKLRYEQQVKRYRLYLWIAILVIMLLVLLWMVLRMKSNKDRIKKEQNESLLKRVLVIYADHQKDARQRIMNEFKSSYPKTHDSMLAAYPDLTEQEYELCVLSHLPFRSKEIALLFGVQENTIYRYRTVIRKKLGTDDLGALVSRFLD